MVEKVAKKRRGGRGKKLEEKKERDLLDLSGLVYVYNFVGEKESSSFFSPSFFLIAPTSIISALDATSAE